MGCCRLSIEERTASAIKVCLNGSVTESGVPVGRFSLVAGTDVRGLIHALGMVCPGPGMILVKSGFSNSIHPCIPAGLELVCT